MCRNRCSLDRYYQGPRKFWHCMYAEQKVMVKHIKQKINHKKKSIPVVSLLRVAMPFGGPMLSKRVIPTINFEVVESQDLPGSTVDRLVKRPNFNRAPRGWATGYLPESNELWVHRGQSPICLNLLMTESLWHSLFWCLLIIDNNFGVAAEEYQILTIANQS